MPASYKHITAEQRYLIKELLDKGADKKEIARKTGINLATVYREIKRGEVSGKYDPEYSEQKYRQSLRDKGAEPVLSLNTELADYISTLITDKNMSLNQVILHLNGTPKYKDCIKSRNTLYKAIDDGRIPGVTRDSLRSNSTVVFGDGNIYIPKHIREELGISIGDMLKFEVIDGKIIYSKE